MPPRIATAVPSLSLVIPAYNESRRISASLRSIGRYLETSAFDPVEVIVVDDGSRDGTAEEAISASRAIRGGGAELRVISNPNNRGKGYSVQRAMQEARHDWLLCSDADLSTPITELDRLIAAAGEGGYDVAIGSRALDRSLIGDHQPLYREALGRVFNLNVRLLTGLPIADTQCGFKLFSRQAARQIAARQRLAGFGFDVEQLYLARKLGFRIAEIAVRWNNDADSSVTLRSGLRAFADVWRVKWNDWTGRYH